MSHCEDIIIEIETEPVIIEMTPEGADGVSLNPRGDWNSADTYAKRDLVAYQGNSYVALKSVPVGTPPTNTEFWMENAAGGNEAYWGNIRGTLSNQTDLAEALAEKADASDVYTKTETDNLLAGKADTDDVYDKTEVYTKTETDDLLEDKADADDVYTKTEADDLLDLKADKADVYTQTELDGIFDGIDNALSAKADKTDVYTKTEADALLNAKANAADLGDLATQDTVDYQTEVTNKPALGALASMDAIDYTSDKLTNKPTLGALASKDSVDYQTEVTNKPTLGALAGKDSVDYDTEITGKPTLGTMSEESASDYYDKDAVNALINASGVTAELDVSGSIASFQTNLAEDLSRLTVSIEPVQSGSGDPSPSNIRPISGHTEAVVTRTEKNWLPNDLPASTYLDGITITTNADKSITISGQGNGSSNPFFYLVGSSGQFPYLLRAGSYILSQGTALPTDNFIRLTSVGGIIAQCQGISSVSFTLAKDTYVLCYLRVDKNSDYTTPKTIYPMIRLSDADDTYQPYQGQQVTIDLGGARYGGTLDVLNGVLKVTNENIASYNGETLPSTWISSMDVYAPGTTPTTGAQVVYKLAEPVYVTLTAHQVQALAGQNYVWASTGDTRIGYWENNTEEAITDVKQLMADYTDTMTAPRNLTVNEFVAVNARLLKVTANVASGSALVVGTNVVETTIAEQLTYILSQL